MEKKRGERNKMKRKERKKKSLYERGLSGLRNMKEIIYKAKELSSFFKG